MPPSNDASALTTGTLPIARIADGDITAAKLGSTLDLSGKTVTLGTTNTTSVDFGNWTITESAGVLYFATGGTNKMKLDASGNLTVVGDVTAYGTV